MSDEGQSLTTHRFGRELCITCSDGIWLAHQYEKHVVELEAQLETMTHEWGMVKLAYEMSEALRTGKITGFTKDTT